ncbi:hypothetical protein GCM10028791_42690 [Echinicola sediminis]
MEWTGQDGYEWIYWGDDDNPPEFDHVFEKLLTLGKSMKKKGLLGCVGHNFNKKKGVINRTPDEYLAGKGYLEVDSIAGGMSLLVHSEVVIGGVLPDERIFFGFEELDFCLRVKEAGFKIWVDKELFYEMRKKSGRLSLKKKYYQSKSKEQLYREYYSLRNLLFLAKKNGYHQMRLILYIKWGIKLFYGFRHGFSYGKINAFFIIKAFADHFQGRMGKMIIK